MKHIKRLLATVLVVLLAFGGFYGYCYYRDEDPLALISEWTDRAKEAVKGFADTAQSKISETGFGIAYDAADFEEDPDLPGFSAATERFQSYTLSEAEYYQYNALSGKDREMYEAIVAGIRAGTPTVKIADYQADSETVFRVYRAVTADHPEFFFLAKSFLYTMSSSGKGEKLILLYTDGKTNDQYDKKGNLTASADRETIDRQITQFSARIAVLKAGIDTKTDLWGIEKQLHDTVIDTVSYDDEAAKEAGGEGAVEGHAFDAYGAACEGKAVCEGYAKLFQHLCYCYGFNCTTVSGTADGEGHLWNAVKMNGEWTLVDVTWDDAHDEETLRYYKYFNRTDTQMQKDHRVEDNGLSVPKCVLEEGAFSRRFAFSVSSLDSAPDNYKEVLDRLAAGSDRFVCMEAEGSEKEIGRYLTEQIFDKDSKVQKYILDKGYAITFSENSYMTDEYYYLLLS